MDFNKLAKTYCRSNTITRTERDIPINYVLWGLLIICLIIAVKLAMILLPNTLGISLPMRVFTLLTCVVYLFLASFVCSAIGGYFAGLVGTSNSPISGLILSSLLLLALLILTIVGGLQINHHLHQAEAIAAGGLVIIISAFVGTAATTACEVAQVSKVGIIVKATPWKQQIILIISVGIVAFIVPLILQLLFNAYGMAGVFPRPGMPVSQMLPAPQAGLIAAISQAVFTHQIPWSMLGIGILIAIACIIIDEFLKKHYHKRLLVLAVGLGIYLPISLVMPIIVGGILSHLIRRSHIKTGAIKKAEHTHDTKGMHNALFLACGVVAGSTIMGVILAIPFAIYKNPDVLRMVPLSFDEISWIFSFIITALLCYWIYKVGIKQYPDDK
jgi:putative OPT family oligopeptide transporter